MANSVDLDEVAHHEPPHQDLCCLQIQLFSSVVVKELNIRSLAAVCSGLFRSTSEPRSVCGRSGVFSPGRFLFAHLCLTICSVYL